MAAEQITVMLTLLAAYKKPVSRFLDLGCGDGILGAAILEKCPRSRGVLVDFSEPMLAAARQKLANFEAQLSFLKLDYAEPEWACAVRPHGPFDAIVSGYSIHHQTDERKRALYIEIFGLLQPGGWFINVEHVSPASDLTTRLFHEHITEAWYVSQRRDGGVKSRDQVVAEFNKREDRAANILVPVDMQCAWLRQIGYQEVDCYFKIYELAVFAGRHPEKDI
jgi:ubiquinone/menaquinone biosynthesis C-methylase UbiE